MSQSTLKRRKESQHSVGEKKPRACFPVGDSFEDHPCSACEAERVEDMSLCVNLDLPASVYFSLALMMTDSSQHDLLQNHYENNTIKTLAEYANRLPVECDLAEGALSILRVLLRDFEYNNLLSIRDLMQSTSLHPERELKFISSCVSDMKLSIRDMLLDHEITIDWEGILLSDIRFARLMPLFGILKDVSCKNVLLSPIPSSLSLPEIFDDSNVIVLSSDGIDAQDYDSQLVLSSSEEYNARNFILPSLSSAVNSQEGLYPPDTQITAEFSIPSSQWPVNNTSQQTDDNLVLDQDEENCLLDIPDYEMFTNIELKSKLKTYGYKASNNRKQMIKDLRKIFTSIHSSRNSSRSCTSTSNNDTANHRSSDILMTPDIEQDITFDLTSQPSSSQETSNQKTVDPVVKESIIRHLRLQTGIWDKILRFSPVTIDECVAGTKFKKSDVKVVLDEAAAIYGQPQKSTESQ